MVLSCQSSGPGARGGRRTRLGGREHLDHLENQGGDLRRHQLGARFDRRHCSRACDRSRDLSAARQCSATDLFEVETRALTASRIVLPETPYDGQDSHRTPPCRPSGPSGLPARKNPGSDPQRPGCASEGRFPGVAPAPPILTSVARCRPVGMPKPLRVRHLGVTAMPRKRHGDASPKPFPCLAQRISARHGSAPQSAPRGEACADSTYPYCRCRRHPIPTPN